MSELGAGSRFSEYVIERLVGRGGFGAVYLARDTRLERRVALKILEPHLATDPDARRRFIDESRQAASLDHPDIVPIYEAGEAEGRLFLAMRYVPGPDLAGLLEREGALEPIRAGRIVAQVASALDAAHAAGLVHRDVKPGNVLLAAGTDEVDHAYLTDFGLSKRVSGGGGVSQTRAGRFVGTVGYVAPEQVHGRSIDARADTYSLACLAYHALTGSVPFERESEIGTITAHTDDPPPSVHAVLPDVADRVDPVLAKAMAKEPAARYGSAGAFAADLSAALASRRSGAAVTRGFLFADLRGYTAFIEEHGDDAAVRLLDAFRRMVRLVVAREGGAEIRTEGDSFYVVFDSASAAVRAGLAIVAGAGAETAARPELPMRVGVGVHAGESAAWVEGYVGSNVNIAARLCAQADEGEVLVSDTVRTLIRTSGALAFDDRGTRELKGIDEPMAVFSAHPVGEAGPTPRPKPRSTTRSRRTPVLLAAVIGLLVLTLGAIAWIVATNESTERGGAVVPASATDGRLLYANALEPGVFHTVDADGSDEETVFAADGPIWSPTWSPDGQRIAFIADDGVRISAANGADQTRLAALDDQPVQLVDWSPAGDELLLTLIGESDDDRAVARIGSDGSDFRILDLGPDGPACPWQATWSADGASILVAGQTTDETGCVDDPRIWIARADGSEARPLLRGPASGLELEPAWAPAGDRIAFVRDVSDLPGTEQILVLTDPDGASVRELLRADLGPGSGGFSSLTWSPDGSRIAFSGEENRMWVLDVDAGEMAPLGPARPDEALQVDWGPPESGGPPGPVMPSPGDASGSRQVVPAAGELEGLADAGWLAGMVSEDEIGEGAFHLVSADGTRQTRITIPEANRGCCFWPQLSPDGSAIAFVDRLPQPGLPASYAGPGELWVSSHDGTNAVRLIGLENGRGVVGSPAWSPDGERLAVATMRGDIDSPSGHAYTIVTVGRAGGDPVPVTTPTHLETRDPTWSADGRTIAFERIHEDPASDVADGPAAPDVRRHILEVDLTTGVERDLRVAGLGSAADPAWSPIDGRIAYTVSAATARATDIEIAAGGGRAVSPLTDDGRSDRAVWSPDAVWLAVSRTDGSARIISADGSAVGALPELEGFVGRGFVPTSWGPDPARSPPG